MLLPVKDSPLRRRARLTRRAREGGLADELGGGAGELPARSSVSEVNGGGVFLTDVPDGQKDKTHVISRAQLVLMTYEPEKRQLTFHCIV